MKSRIDVIGANGNEGLHYEDKVEAWTQHKEGCECCWCLAARVTAARRGTALEALKIAHARMGELIKEIEDER